MNALVPLALLTVAAACSGCASSAPTVAAANADDRGLLRGSDCLDPAMARSWEDLDDRTLLVDAGRHKYRIELSASCTAIYRSPMLVFRGDPISGRVCATFATRLRWVSMTPLGRPVVPLE